MLSLLLSLVVEPDRARMNARKTPQVDLAGGEASRFCHITGAGHVDRHLTAPPSLGIASREAGCDALGFSRQRIEIGGISDHHV